MLAWFRILWWWGLVVEVGACWVCCPGHWIIFSGRAGLAPGVVSGIGLTHKFDRKSSREWFHYRTLWAYIMVHPWVTMIACTHNVPQWIVQDQSISFWHWIYVCNGMFWEIPLIIFCRGRLSLFRRTPESLGNRAHRVRGHGAPRRVLRRRFHDLGKAPEAQGLLKNELVIGVDLVNGSLWWWSSWRTCVQSCWEMCCIIDVLTISHSRIMEHYFERWHVTIYIHKYINILAYVYIVTLFFI